MDPTIWGPLFWKVLHKSSFVAPRDAFTRLMKLMETLLPCPHCRSSYVSYCAKSPLSCDDASPPTWLWKIHDDVDVKLNKPNIPFSKLKRRCDVLWTLCDEDLWAVLFICILAIPDDPAPDDTTVAAAAELGVALSSCFEATNILRAPRYLNVTVGGTTIGSILDEYIEIRARFDVDAGNSRPSKESVVSKYDPVRTNYTVARTDVVDTASMEREEQHNQKVASPTHHGVQRTFSGRQGVPSSGNLAPTKNGLQTRSVAGIPTKPVLASLPGSKNNTVSNKEVVGSAWVEPRGFPRSSIHGAVAKRSSAVTRRIR